MGRPRIQYPVSRKIQVKCSRAWEEWLVGAAKLDRCSVAVFLDRAASRHADAIGYKKPAPERYPKRMKKIPEKSATIS